MESKKVNTTSVDVKKSISSIYAELLNKRRTEREQKAEQKRLEKEAKKSESDETAETDENPPLSKKEKREARLNSWKEIIVGLTGDDLDYVSTKKSKKKYKKWINGDNDENIVLSSKPRKKKKRNYSKEFEPEINMLKAIVADQNKFTTDLQKRYQNAAGPNTKDAMPLNKTLVELAAVINNSRSNSLGVLKEIGNLKKTIADLYMKQVKLDADTRGEGFGTQDLGIMGSNLASSLFSSAPSYSSQDPIASSPVSLGDMPATTQQSEIAPPTSGIQKFDPGSWDGGGLSSGNAKYEAIPHTVIVEWHKESDKARFKAIRNDNGEELVGCPVPTCTIKAIDVKSKVAKDDFDQVYQVEIIE